jgi:hypothetical protein
MLSKQKPGFDPKLKGEANPSAGKRRSGGRNDQKVAYPRFHPCDRNHHHAVPFHRPAPGKNGTSCTGKNGTGCTGKNGTAAPESGIYIVVKGDTLWDISNSLLKDPFLWPLIWKENPFIKNPDLIYPGNRLVIPSLALIERALQAPAEAAPLEEGAEKAVTKARPPTAPAGAAPAAEEEPARRGLILEQEAAHPLIDKYTMLSASYVSTDTWEESIAGALEPKNMLGFDDIVFIKVNAPDNVNIGDKYLIFAPVKKVKHPQTGKGMGRDQVSASSR